MDEAEVRSLSRFSHVDFEQIDDCLRELGVGGTKVPIDSLGVDSSPARYTVETARRQSADAIDEVLREYAALLRDVFAFYSISASDMQGGAAAGGSTVTMSSPEFWRFVKDVKMVDGRALISSQVDLIFIAANNDTRTGMPRQEEDNSVSELLPHEFVECLLRLSLRRFSGSGKPAHERLRKLIVNVIEPRACRSDSNTFRAHLVSAPVQTVFKRHRKSLERVFAHYAMVDKDMSHHHQKGDASTINHPEFVQMCKDCHIFDNAFTELVAGIVFANVQQDEVDPTGVSVAGGYGEMIFSEFLEAVGAMCMYKCPMPYEPFEQRLEHFISGTLLKQAGQMKSIHSAHNKRGGGAADADTAAEERANALTGAMSVPPSINDDMTAVSSSPTPRQG